MDKVMDTISFLITPKEELHASFVTACKKGNLKKVQRMLGHKKVGINKPDAKYGASPLYYACQRGRVDLVRHLLQHPDIDPNTVAECTGPASLFVDDYCFPSMYFRTPLHIACARGNLQLVQMLLDHPKIDANILAAGMTPLQAAILNGQELVVRLLLSSPKVCVNQVNEDMDTALHVACETGSVPIINLLLAQPGIKLDVRNCDGLFPMSTACAFNNFEVVTLFLQHLDHV